LDLDDEVHKGQPCRTHLTGDLPAFLGGNVGGVSNVPHQHEVAMDFDALQVGAGRLRRGVRQRRLGTWETQGARVQPLNLVHLSAIHPWAAT
jgi:hypothetical protein